MCRCDPLTNCRSALETASFSTQGQLFNSSVGKKAKNLSARLLLQKSSAAAQKAAALAAAHLQQHKKVRSSSIALGRPHYEGITWGSCGGRWPLQGKCLEAVQETVAVLVFARRPGATWREKAPQCRVQTRQQLYCDVLHFLQTFRRTRCRQRESSWSTVHSFLLFDLARVKVFFFPPISRSFLSWQQPSAYLRTF